MTPHQIHIIVQTITYKPDWVIYYNQVHSYIQIHVINSIDSVTGKLTEWKSGKRYLDKYMCRQEIVGAVYGLIEAAELHEMREWFRYRGKSIYNPHIDPDKLVEMMQAEKVITCRKNAMLMGEE